MTATNMTITINGGRTITGGSELAARYSQFVGFGDSNSDSGYFFTHQISNNPSNQNFYNQARAVGGGLPTDPGYQMHTTLLAGALGLTAIPVGLPNGTNYAASGASISGVSANPLAPNIVQQISTYLSSTNNVVDSQALYYFSGGGNSVKVAEETYAIQADQIAHMEREAHLFATAIQSLANAGARNIVIGNLNGSSILSQSFNATLWADLEAFNVNFILADIRNLVRQVTASPSEYGLLNVVVPPEGPFNAQNPYNPANGGSTLNPTQSSGWARFASQDVSPNAANTYLWADNEHLSGAGQRIEARYILNALDNAHPNPGEVLTATRFITGVSSVTASEMSYQWQRHIDGSSTWSNIAGATSISYTVSSADIGYELRLVASFNRPGQSASATSPATATVSQATTDLHGLNVVYDTNGSDNVSGTAANLDVVTYVGNKAVYNVSIAPGSVTITGSGVDHLIAIDRIQFSDGIIAFDTAGHAGDAYRVYQAAFNRTPDTPGLSYWVGQMDDGMPLSQVALNFILSPEFTATYGDINAMSDTAYVTVAYQNVLHRAPDQAGLAYWLNDLSHGYPRHAMLAAFSQSTENQANVAAAIQNGILLDLGAFV